MRTQPPPSKDNPKKIHCGALGASRQVTTKSTFTADGGSGTNTLVNDDDNLFAKDPVFTSLTQA